MTKTLNEDVAAFVGTSTIEHRDGGIDADDDSIGWSSTNETTVTTCTTKERLEKEMGKSSIARREDKIVTIVRALVLIAIVGSAVAVSVAVWFFATGNEKATYELEYEGYVKDIESLVVWEVKYNMALVQQLGGTTTSAALMTQQTFPNVVRVKESIDGIRSTRVVRVAL